ncbi:hypothetical protein SSPIM334S_07977 [Streptomyces spiroverticillatus]
MVHFERERVGHLRQRQARPHPFQYRTALPGLDGGPRAVRASAGLGLVGAPPLA